VEPSVTDYEFTTESVPISPELERALMWSEEQADLAFAGDPLTGFELDAIEELRSEYARKLDYAVIFGVEP